MIRRAFEAAVTNLFLGPRSALSLHERTNNRLMFQEKWVLGDGPPVPTIVFHGDRDITVHPDNGDHILEQSMGTTRTQKRVHRGRVPGGHVFTRTVYTDASGRGIFEHWNIHGAGHAWSGGSPVGSYTDPRGPDATREMLRFFLEHSLLQQPG